MCGYSITEHASLVSRNTLRVDARATRLAEVYDASRLPDLLDLPAIKRNHLLVLGEGSNILFTGDIDGTVLTMATRGIQVERDGKVTRITVAAGESWNGFVRWTLEQGYAGLENLILIPGTVGAAPVQNIGAYGIEVAEFIESVEAWDRRDHRVALLDHAACAFAYRDSIFKHQPGRYIVTAVRFILPRLHKPRLDYAGIREELAHMGVEHPAPLNIAEAVIRLRTRKLPDPAIIGNAGSFFKNPLVDAAQGEALKNSHPELAAWIGSDGRWKLSAAWLIEASGLKGAREGDAGISSQHALVLVNHGHATGMQLWNFAQGVIGRVRERFGVTLEPEPVVIGRAAS